MLRTVFLSGSICLRNKSPRNAGNKKYLKEHQNIVEFITLSCDVVLWTA